MKAGYDMQEVEEALSRLYRIKNVNEEVFSDSFDIEIAKTYEVHYSLEHVEEVAIIARKDEKDKEFEYIRINLDTLEYEFCEPTEKELELFDNE